MHCSLLKGSGYGLRILVARGSFSNYIFIPSTQDVLTIGNQSRPKIFDLNIRRAPPLYSAVIEVDERVTLVGYTSDPKAGDHAVQFDDNGKVTKAYSGTAWTHEDEGKGEIVQGLSGEAVQILRKPGEVFHFARVCSQG